MKEKIQAAICETLVIDNKQSVWRAVEKILLIVKQEQASSQLLLIEKAIDDTFNQVHYSLLHPDVVKPVEHNAWREDWIKKNCGNCT